MDEDNKTEIDDRAADLAAAFEEHEEDTQEELVSEQEAFELVSEAEVPEETVQAETSEEAPPVVAEEAPVQPDIDTEQAPSSLPPEAREVWKDAPAPLKAAIAKREKDYEAGIMKYAQDAKRAQGMDQTLEPYRQYLEMNGGPGQTIQTLLNAGATLQMGNPQQKAQLIAGLIKDNSIDIQMLDGMLVGQAPQSNISPEVAALQQQVGQLTQQRDQQQQYQQQQAQQANMAEWNKFRGENEFANDLAPQIANYMDMKIQQGENPSLKDAYDFACQMNPTIKGILDARAQAEQIGGKRAAASSLKGGPSGPGQRGPKDDSIAATIEWAMDNAGQI